MRILTMQIVLMMSYVNVKAQNDLAILNDEFNDSSKFNEWQSHHQTENWPPFTERCEIVEEESILKIIPQSSGWYGEFHRGPFFYKEVKGNFTVTTKVYVSGKKTESPQSSYSLAGLMVRNKRAANTRKNDKGNENWMFLSTGSATKKGKPQLESKNTTNGKSKLRVFSGKQGWIYISISRVNNTFYQLYRFADSTDWTLLRVIERPDFANTIQVGMLAYTDFWRVALKVRFNRKQFNTKPIEGKPDVVARFDYIHFFRIDKRVQEFIYEPGYHLTRITEQENQLLHLE